MYINVSLTSFQATETVYRMLAARGLFKPIKHGEVSISMLNDCKLAFSQYYIYEVALWKEIIGNMTIPYKGPVKPFLQG